MTDSKSFLTARSLCVAFDAYISRGAASPRLRDFYDIHTLGRLRRNECEPGTLAEALDATAAKRGTMEAVRDWEAAVSDIGQILGGTQRGTTSRFPYVTGLELADVCATIREIMTAIAAAKSGKRLL